MSKSVYQIDSDKAVDKEIDQEVNERIRGKGVHFDKIRRITGYLVGNIDRWNNAKRAEERDRVKHDGGI